MDLLLLLMQAGSGDGAIHITLTGAVLTSLAGNLWQMFGKPKNGNGNGNGNGDGKLTAAVALNTEAVKALSEDFKSFSEKFDKFALDAAREAGRAAGRAEAARAK